jgi:hypothetical protein
MAIKFKSSLGVEDLLSHLKLDYTQEYFTHHGYEVDLGISEIRLCKAEDGTILATIKPGGLISKIKSSDSNSTLWVRARSLISGVMIELMKNGKQPIGLCDQDWFEKTNPLTDLLKVSTLGNHGIGTLTPNGEMTPGITPIDTQFTIPFGTSVITPGELAPVPVINNSSVPAFQKEEPPVATKNEIVNGSRCALRDATKLYQPVKGTSTGARYYVVGISKEGVKIAVKKPDSAISVRVEAEKPIPPKVLETFGTFGISNKDGYLSGHFTLNHCTPNRFIGALLADLGLEWKTPLPNLQQLEVAP